MEDMQQLGGNIELTGFKEMDGGSMIILKKIIGSYARRFSDRLEGIDKLSIAMKKVGASQFEVNCMLCKSGQRFNSEVVDYNLFVAIDQTLKKIEGSALK